METNPNNVAEYDLPLILDVDGTLLRTDLLYETFWAALGRDFGKTLLRTAITWKRPERLKLALSEIAKPRIDQLPVREAVHKLVLKAKESGRAVHLVSGSNQQLIDELGKRLDLPGPHFGSDSDRNLTGSVKADFLEDQFGPERYDYAGNSQADLKSWTRARKVIVVDPDAALAREIQALGKPATLIAENWGLPDVFREIRPHQWVKNLLLFVPLIASHSFAIGSFFAVCLAAIAFSFGASSIYILNDLLDLEADRSHPEKRLRPIASGDLPIAAAMKFSALLGLLAIFLALLVSPQLALLALGYMAGSLSYSLWFKKFRWLDLMALTGLFLLRILAGAVAAETGVTAFLIVLGFFVFFTLACVKRLTALSRMPLREHLPGRGYSDRDRRPLVRAAYTGAWLSGGIFLAHFWVWNEAAQYSKPLFASFAVLPLVLWLLRMVRLSIAGREDYDPVRFAMRDPVGLALAALGVMLIVLAA